MTLGGPDRAALTDLVHRYAADVDDRRFDSVAELFTEDAELKLPDPPATLEPVHQHRGRAAIRDAVATVAATIRTQHGVIGEVYDAGPRPGTARGRIACIAHHWIQHGDQLRDVTWHLRYDDEYQCIDTEWRIRSRVLTIDAIDNRQVRQVRRGASG
jgi:SnoaL-like domain